jgi:hypothetical protein
VAFSLSEKKRRAWAIIFSEQDSGKKFNFNTGEFEGKT